MALYGGKTLSAITVQSMADLGYGVDVTQADAYTLPGGAATVTSSKDAVPAAAIRGDDRVRESLASLIDLVPTILDAAGLPASEQVTGKSLMKILRSDRSGVIEQRCDRTHFAFEAHHTVGPYQAWIEYMSGRAIQTDKHLYIRNYSRQGHPGWKPVQGGPAVGIMQKEMAADETVRRNYELCFGHRPEEELYDVKADPYQMHNLADDHWFSEVKKTLQQALQ